MREYSHFLTPRYSLLSADIWTFVAIYLRNLLLNWLVFIPLLICVLTLPRLFLSVVAHQPTGADPSILFLVGILLAAFSIAYIGINRPSMGDALYGHSKFWRRRTNQKSFLIYCLGMLSLSALLVSIAWAWMDHSGTALLISSWWPHIPKRIHFSSLQGNHLLSSVFTWIYPFRWYYLFAFASYAIGTIFSATILRRGFKDLLRGVVFYALALAPVSAILLWVLTTHVFRDPQRHDWVGLYAVFAPPLYLLVWLLSITLVVGLVSRNYSHHLRIPSLRARFPRDEDQEWYARLGGWMLIAIVIWMVLNSLVIFGPLVLLASPKIIASLGGGSGIFAALGGHSAKTPATPDKASQQSSSKKSIVSTVLSLVMPYILTIASLVFIMFLIAGLSLLTSIILHLAFPQAPIVDEGIRATIHNASLGQIIIVLLIALAIASIAAVLINLNKFSLHASYATRLIRTYLGASRSRTERRPNRFTGFDPGDNIQMGELRPGLLQERSFKDLSGFVKELASPTQANVASFKSRLNKDTQALLDNHDDTNPPEASLKGALVTNLNSILETQYLYGDRASEKPTPATSQSAILPDIRKNRRVFDELFKVYVEPYHRHAYKLFHVINMTLNLFHGDNLAWQQRKAESFTTSALHSGSFNLGYRETKNYGGPDGISLGTAATLSGAAVNSNMGSYFSSALVSFVLTFFNARLGLWLGNPGIAGNDSYTRAYPRVPVLPIILEAFGYTDDKSRFVNLSDGGHFENLALYQMVVRRCNFIMVVDGGEDGECKFNDLGNAVRKIRIDLGIPIEFQHIPIYPRDNPNARDGTYWAVGRIRYSEVDGSSEEGVSPDNHDGLLLYVKPAFYGREPSDIFNYAKTHETFPHQTTANQFFDESQFESYRMLGSYIMNQLCGGARSQTSIAGLVRNAFARSKGENSSSEFESWVSEWLNARSPGSAPPAQDSQFHCPLWLD